MSTKSKYLFLAIIFVLIVSSIWIYEGHFLFSKPQNSPKTALEPEKQKTEKQRIIEQPIQYKHISTLINGNKQEINILELDPGNKKIEIKPVLSYDSVFGFEKLSTMYKRSNAYAAVNAGFFYEYGNPGGMVAIDGRLIIKSTGKNPVLLINKGTAELKEIETKIWALYQGKRISIQDINVLGDLKDSVLFTRDFGLDNRLKKENVSLVIENNIITNIIKGNGKTEIPKMGTVLTFIKPLNKDFLESEFKVGEEIEFTYEPMLEANTQAYECGSWIVKDGKIVIGDKDDWVGVLTNWDPRTAVGIKEDGKVVLLTVDGRQPGYSVGLTAKELGRYFLDMGVKDAGMLDGGASTEMIIDGKIVSKPSFKGEERLVGGAIVVKWADDN